MSKKSNRRTSNVSLPEDLHSSVLAQADNQGRTISSIHESALRLYMSWQANDPQARAFLPPSLEVDRVVLRQKQLVS